jgi:hypothetical protein
VIREPEWDDESRSWALALALREELECRRCGGDLVETTNYDNKFLPLDPLVCLNCISLRQSEKDYAKHPHAAGMIHRTKRVDRPKPKSRSRRKG